MNASDPSDAEMLRVFHEHQMTEGQKSYFSLDHRGALVPHPSQRAWVDLHLRKATRLLALRPQDVLLDLGCGEGHIVQSLSSKARLTLGVDFSLPALRLLKNSPSSSEQHLQLAVASGEALPLPTGSVDKVLCNHVLEHVLDDEAVIGAIRRVLRPGGHAVIGVPLAFTPQTQVLTRLRRFLCPHARRLQLESVAPGQLVPELIGKQSHIRFYSLRALCALLEGHAFRILRAEGVGFAMRGPFVSHLRRNPLLVHLGTIVGQTVPAFGDGVLVLAERL